MRRTLQDHLSRWIADAAENERVLRDDVARTVTALATACLELGEVIAQGALAGSLGAATGAAVTGDVQVALDVQAHDLMLAALATAPVAVVASEEAVDPIMLRPDASLAVALDPLDGSSNVATNVSIGTIFSILPMLPGSTPEAALLQAGSAQLAAGFVIYGPQTILVLSVGAGVTLFTLDRRTGRLVLTADGLVMPTNTHEFAINVSNYRHWDDAVRTYIDDCIAGANGVRAADFNMRWIASVVAEAYRILTRGGIYLYPRDARPAYRNGRLRLIYEANPLALLVEQAGGAASDGSERILDLIPKSIHQRVGLVFGAQDKVERVRHHYQGLRPSSERSALFGARGLFRADSKVSAPCL